MRSTLIDINNLTQVLDAIKIKLNNMAGGKNVSSTGILKTSDWINNSQTINVVGVTDRSNIIVSAAPISGKIYYINDIYCKYQGEGTVTFECATVPDADVNVNILILEG